MGDMPRRTEATVKHEGKGKAAERGQHTEKKGGRKQWIRILSIALSVLLVCCVGRCFGSTASIGGSTRIRSRCW